MVAHKHAKSIWTTVRVRNDDLRTVLIVETDLSLNRDAPDYDEVAANDLFAAVVEFVKANAATIDEADIVPIRP